MAGASMQHHLSSHLHLRTAGTSSFMSQHYTRHTPAKPTFVLSGKTNAKQGSGLPDDGSEEKGEHHHGCGGENAWTGGIYRNSVRGGLGRRIAQI